MLKGKLNGKLCSCDTKNFTLKYFDETFPYLIGTKKKKCSEKPPTSKERKSTISSERKLSLLLKLFNEKEKAKRKTSLRLLPRERKIKKDFQLRYKEFF